MGKKVHFKYGVMGSSKSLDLIRAEYNYRERGHDTFVISPAVNTRDGGQIRSRVGLSLDAVNISKEDNLFNLIRTETVKNGRNIQVIFIDEVHFLTVEQVNEVAEIADNLNIPVLCYGLKSDFRGILFPATQRLIELADELEEIRAVCDCDRKAMFNARFINGKPTKSGEQIMVGDQEYKSFCRKCYNNLWK